MRTIEEIRNKNLPEPYLTESDRYFIARIEKWIKDQDDLNKRKLCYNYDENITDINMDSILVTLRRAGYLCGIEDRKPISNNKLLTIVWS